MTDSTLCDGFADDYSAFLDAELETGRADEIAAHLETCALCNERIDALRGVDVLLRAVPAAATPPDFYARLQSRIAESEATAPGVVPVQNRRRGTAAPGRRAGGRMLRTGFGIAVAAGAAALLAVLLLPGTGPEPHRGQPPEDRVANADASPGVSTPENPSGSPETQERVRIAEAGSPAPQLAAVEPAPQESTSTSTPDIAGEVQSEPGSLVASFDGSSADDAVEFALALDLETVEDFDVIANLDLLERLIAFEKEAG